MKTNGICPKCQHIKIGHFLYVADETDATNGPGSRRALWWQKSKGFFKGEDRADVEAYVCTECGYFEEYVINPKSVSWEDLRPFKWHSLLKNDQ